MTDPSWRLRRRVRPEEAPNAAALELLLAAKAALGRHPANPVPGPNPLGTLPGSVWPMSSEPLNVPDYFVEDDRGWRLWGTKRYGKPRRPKDAGEEGLFAAAGLPKGAPMVPELVALWQYVARRMAEGYEGPIRIGSIDHFAAFPTELPRRIILGWSPAGICVECGEGRRPVVETDKERVRPPSSRLNHTAGHAREGREDKVTRATILGYACACTPYTDHPGERVGVAARIGSALAVPPGNIPRQARGGLGAQPRNGSWREYHLPGWTPPPSRPAVVLDPFGGTGTTAMVARALGRIGISVDFSADYSRLARWRVFGSGAGKKAEQRTWKERQLGLMLL